MKSFSSSKLRFADPEIMIFRNRNDYRRKGQAWPSAALKKPATQPRKIEYGGYGAVHKAGNTESNPQSSGYTVTAKSEPAAVKVESSQSISNSAPTAPSMSVPPPMFPPVPPPASQPVIYF